MEENFHSLPTKQNNLISNTPSAVGMNKVYAKKGTTSGH
jgi:hypothetical protein